MVYAPKNQLEKDLRSEIICMCGTCGRKRVGECTCSLAEQMRKEIASLVASGKNHDQIIEFYVNKYGSQEVLASPIDKGFNRLAWILPYAVGLLGIAFVGGVAVRWTRRSTGAGATAPHAPRQNEDALERQLDDELRDLD